MTTIICDIYLFYRYTYNIPDAIDFISIIVFDSSFHFVTNKVFEGTLALLIIVCHR